MLKLLKYLKRSVIPILVIIALLVVQAMCDLSLPDYTSTIVNVGIQQQGIESSVPDVMRKSTLNNLKLFMAEEDQQKLDDAYTKLEQQNYTDSQWNKKLKQYPALKDETLYELADDSQETIDELEPIISKSFLILSALEDEEDQQVQDMMSQITANLPAEAIAQISSPLDLIRQIPQEQREQLLKQSEEQFTSLPESMIGQSTIPQVKAEYDAIGMDTGSMQIQYLLWSGLRMLGIALVSMASTIIVTLLASRVAASLSRELRGRVFKKVVSFSSTEMDHFSTASLITRSTNDIQQVQLVMVLLLRIVFYAPIIAIGGVIKVTQSDASMSWVIAIAVLAIVVIVGVMFSVAMPKFKKMQKLVDRLNLVTREILTGLPVIRAFSTEKYEEERFDKANKNLMKTNLFVNRVMACMMPAMMFVMNAIAVLVVWVGSHGVDNGTMQVGNMMAFIQYTMQIIMAFLMISMISVLLPRASVAANRIIEVLETDLTISDPEQPKQFSKDAKGVLEFRNVSFHYPNASEDVLKQISFTAIPGQTTAFIGSTGSGKSTLVNLIPRFYDVTQGEILIDGIDIREVSQHDLRKRLGYVPQKGVLFSGTVDSNIKYGEPGLDDSVSREAAEVAQATDFIEKLPDQFDYEISQGGTNVSGGQKQRLSIARAIAKSPDIYIFDDSFSALDYKTDVKLRSALKHHTSDSTVLIVAQRISTILHAEQIIVLDEGKIVGKGTHQELLKNCKVYQQIAESQLSKEELDHE